MKLPNSNQTNLLIIISSISFLGYALYTQYYEYLEPCPLCMTQRLFYILVATFAVLAMLHRTRKKIYSGLGMLSAAGGIATAGRQVWLQHLPPEQVPACGPSLEYMLETFSLTQTLSTMVTGDGNCAEVVWTFMGFSMGEWSLACFVGYAVINLWQLVRTD